MDPKFGTASLCALKAGMNLLGSQDVTFFWWRYSMKILLISPEVTHFLRNAPKLDNLHEHGSDLGFWRLMHGRAAKSVLRISRSEIRSNTDGKRLSTALQLAALKVAESHQTSSNKQGYDMATLTHEKAADAVNPSSRSLK